MTKQALFLIQRAILTRDRDSEDQSRNAGRNGGGYPVARFLFHEQIQELGLH